MRQAVNEGVRRWSTNGKHVSNKNIVKEHNNLSNTNYTILSKATNNMQILDNDKNKIHVAHPPTDKTEQKFTIINDDYKE